MLNEVQSLVHRHVTARPVILVGADVGRLRTQAAELRSMGADRVLVIAHRAGIPGEENIFGYPVVLVDLVADSHGYYESAWSQVFDNPPAPVRDRVDAFDPTGDAVVLTWRYRRNASFGSRPVYGARPAAAVYLEDKTRFGEFLSGLGVPQPPRALTVPCEFKMLAGAAHMVDRGSGTVWSGDSSSATSAGGLMVRRVRNGREASEAALFFEGLCREVRVAPFVEGVTCGMHAFVSEDDIAVFRPTEQLVLHPHPGSTFTFAGHATYFDPDPADRTAYQAIVRRIGSALRDEFGYRGALSVDAILSSDGWVVHDINPRTGAGLVYLSEVVRGLPVNTLHNVVAEGDAGALDWQRIEMMWTAAADAHRTGAASVAVVGGPRAPRTFRFDFGATGALAVEYTPAAGGTGKLAATMRLRRGVLASPLLTEAVNRVAEELALTVRYEPAPSIRTESMDFGSRVIVRLPGRVAGAAEGVTPSL